MSAGRSSARRGAQMKPWCLMFAAFGFVISAAVNAAQRFPWTFGMSPQDVEAISQYGPYRAFRNGDLETYNYDLGGSKQNFQFYFRDGKLVRISVALYEGRDLSAAVAEWLQLFRFMSENYGEVETPGNTPPIGGNGNGFALRASASLVADAKMQMAPVRQPDDSFVFASLTPREVNGERYYFVSLYFDPPR